VRETSLAWWWHETCTFCPFHSHPRVCPLSWSKRASGSSSSVSQVLHFKIHTWAYWIHSSSKTTE
jgi:hypothetical protein